MGIPHIWNAVRGKNGGTWAHWQITPNLKLGA